MRLPDFIVIGAAKAGTTSLYALLDQHEDVFMPAVKEPEFFARDDRYAKGIESYAANFAAAASGQIVGEASTIYSLSPFFPQTASRIKQHLPQAKLIYVLREPVSRAYSYYLQIVKNYQNTMGDLQVHRSFEECVMPSEHAHAAPRDKIFSTSNAHLPDHPDLCLAGSDYVTQIEAYLAYFPPQQILFLKFEDFIADRAATLRQITDFLGIFPLPQAVFAQKGVTRNVSRKHFEELGADIAIRRLQKGAGPVWVLRQLAPKRLRTKIRALVSASAPTDKALVPPPMAPQTQSDLFKRFATQKDLLKHLTGLEFKEWGW
ncbi:MAG: hypothetical protein ACJAZ1_000089 [Yoonia sp.]|jgi:hypothetical protein